ncbi:MAG TPA: RcpC/CpaB family pilus assembly protein [Gemmataceae bacterium]|nr:RcpC/CpaB family pilus assembly protein [Gemmataceae bacterium]
MRASTLFGLATALFLGVIAVAVIRVSGVLNGEKAPPMEKVDPVMVLVAKTNIFEGTTAMITDVVVRKATPIEAERIKQNPEVYMPPSVDAADLRIAARNIGAGELIKKDHFLEQSIPEGVTGRLAPGMRSVNVVVPRDRAAGGLIRVGEYVDVTLTTTICSDPKCTTSRNATAPLAMNLKVIVKRDSLWTMMAPIPEDKPVSFILEANAYRAALIEFAKTRGTLALVPSGPAKKDRGGLASAREEELKANAFLNGEASVSDFDLQQIFRLPAPQTPEPPVAIEHYKGINFVGTSTHDQKGNNGQGGSGYAFRPPGQVQSGALFAPPSQKTDEKDCPTCNKKS